MKIAVVVPDLAGGGGVPSVARFLVHELDRTPDLDFGLLSLATSASDGASLRLRSPTSWLTRPVAEIGIWEGREYWHVGACLTEFEFQRYKPRRVLTEILRKFDLVQVVAGSPAWCLVASNFPGPVVLQVATLAEVERIERLRRQVGPTGLWRRAMMRLTSRLDREGLGLADRVLVENQWMKETVSTWTDPERVALAPPGIDTHLFRPGQHPSGRPEGEDYILSVGRFDDPRKCAGLLFDAYSRLHSRLPGCPVLVLAGQAMPVGRERESLRGLGIEDSVMLLGEVSRERLAELYRGAELFVLSSAEEGLGLVLLEAMSSEAAVVATRTRGAMQAIEDERSGLLAPVGDADGLAAAMERILVDSSLRAELGLNARSRVERRFSERAAGSAFLETYRSLLHSGGRKEPTPVRAGNA